MKLKTLEHIEQAIEYDQGATFRRLSGELLPTLSDAYSDKPPANRSHLGASLIGDPCARKLWYGFRWAKLPIFEGRILRLFNRGHLEEGRFMAMLMNIGCQIYQFDENGKQWRISHADGHFGGSSDGVVLGIPDMPTTPVLTEFKTHGEKSFIKLTNEGLYQSKFEHYVQMQIYMTKMGLSHGLYLAVNKNTDGLYGEIITKDEATASMYLDRAQTIVFMQTAPDRAFKSPSWFQCKFCNFNEICHYNGAMDVNCRTCKFGIPSKNATWICHKTKQTLSEELMKTGCKDHVQIT